MFKEPLVSIIIPTYNRAHLISETLDSVLAQTYPNWECIVVDDGSTDATEDLVRKYIKKDSRYQYHKRPDKHLSGGNAARNFGFEKSRGEFIQWFDDDDVMLPEFISSKLNLFDDEIKLVICSNNTVDTNLSNPQTIDLKIKYNLYKDYVLGGFNIITNSVLFKKDFLKKELLFNPNIIRGQEAELFSRLFFQLPKQHYRIIDCPLFLYRQHKFTKSVLNKNYKPAFKTSEIYVATENLKRAIILKDSHLIQYFYRLLIHFFFRGLEHQDVHNAKNVLNSLIDIIRPLNWRLVLQLQLMGIILLSHKRGFYKIEMYFKAYKI